MIDACIFVQGPASLEELGQGLAELIGGAATYAHGKRSRVEVVAEDTAFVAFPTINDDPRAKDYPWTAMMQSEGDVDEQLAPAARRLHQLRGWRTLAVIDDDEELGAWPAADE